MDVTTVHLFSSPEDPAADSARSASVASNAAPKSARDTALLSGRPPVPPTEQLRCSVASRNHHLINAIYVYFLFFRLTFETKEKTNMILMKMMMISIESLRYPQAK